jgi:hypothetical protein
MEAFGQTCPLKNEDEYTERERERANSVPSLSISRIRGTKPALFVIARRGMSFTMET